MCTGNRKCEMCAGWGRSQGWCEGGDRLLCVAAAAGWGSSSSSSGRQAGRRREACVCSHRWLHINTNTTFSSLNTLPHAVQQWHGQGEWSVVVWSGEVRESRSHGKSPLPLTDWLTDLYSTQPNHNAYKNFRLWTLNNNIAVRRCGLTRCVACCCLLQTGVCVWCLVFTKSDQPPLQEQPHYSLFCRSYTMRRHRSMVQWGRSGVTADDLPCVLPYTLPSGQIIKSTAQYVMYHAAQNCQTQILQSM